MPRISDNILDCAVYLYPSAGDARAGEAVGGSGFLVGMPSKHEGWYHGYVVTNSHVIREANSPVARLNSKDGKIAIVELGQDDWVHHPAGDDLAAAVAPVAPDTHRFSAIMTEAFVSREMLDKLDIGIGDEVVMVGRFINHEGRQTNSPSVRFGSIAQMAREPILHERGHLQESYLIEARSISGYSGSPVFVYFPVTSDTPRSHAARATQRGPWLLGVDWCHLHQTLNVLGIDGEPITDDHGEEIGAYVKSNTGMMGVVPAWKLAELLDDDRFVRQRAAEDEEIARSKAASPASLDG